MAYSDVTIANLALSRIGVSSPIASLDELTPEAAQAKLWLPIARDAVLIELTPGWPFSIRYVALDLVEAAPNTDWAYAYRLPSAICLRPLSLAQDGLGRNEANPAQIATGSDAQGLLIYSDIANAVLRYVARITDPTFFTAAFVSALAWRLASELAMTVAVRPDFRDRALQMYTSELSAAAAAELNSQIMDQPLDAECIRDRNGWTSGLGFCR